MQMIAAVDRNWAIGNRGQMLVTIPADQQFFRQETMGKVVIMGRKTFESLPGRRTLDRRTNIILSRDPEYRVKGAQVFGNMDELLKELKAYRSEDIFIIGGQTIYEQFLPLCDTAQVTFIDYAYQADTHFPNLDADGAWTLAQCSEEQTYFDICYEFRKYVRK